LLAGDLQLLPGIAVEPIGIDRGDVAPKALDELLPPRLAETGPRGGTDRQPGHRRDVKGPADHRLELREPTALPEDAAVLHRAEQRVIETLHGIAAARRRRMHWVGKHREPDPGGEGYQFAYGCVCDL